MTTHKSHTFLLINFLSPPFLCCFVMGCAAACVQLQQCCSGLVSCIYLKVLQRDRKKERGRKREREHRSLWSQ